MSNEEHLTMLKRGLGAWNTWREQYPGIRPDLSGASLHHANLRLFNISGALLSEANLDASDLTGANLVRANLVGANLSGSILDLADLSGADLRDSDFTGSSGGRLFSRANLRGANFQDVNLSAAKLNGADLREVNLRGALLSGADLSEVTLGRADLRSAYLNQANLAMADLTGANLSTVVALDANFERARLFRANLTEANLSGASLMWADLVEANLDKADLSRANLSYVRLAESELRETRLDRCLVNGIRLSRLRLESAKQSNLVLAFDNTHPIFVDDLETAQAISVFLDSENKGKMLGVAFSGMVLILGCFSQEKRIILDSMRRELKRNGYQSVMVDFSNSALRHHHGNLSALAGLAHFILAEITESKGIAQALVSIVESSPAVPIQPLYKHGSSPWRLNQQMKQYNWVLEPHSYNDGKELERLLGDELIGLAEAKANELAKKSKIKTNLPRLQD